MKMWAIRFALLALVAVVGMAPVTHNVVRLIATHRSLFEIPRESSIWSYRHHRGYGEDDVNYYHRLEPGKIWFFSKEKAAKVAGFNPADFSTWPERLCNSK